MIWLYLVVYLIVGYPISYMTTRSLYNTKQNIMLGDYDYTMFALAFLFVMLLWPVAVISYITRRFGRALINSFDRQNKEA